VQIFIGADLFGLAGCSAVISPYGQPAPAVGAVGVSSAPASSNARIIPMVDYTAKVIAGFSANRPQRRIT
jgi:heat-inducible transcriptional repressor